MVFAVRSTTTGIPTGRPVCSADSAVRYNGDCEGQTTARPSDTSTCCYRRVPAARPTAAIRTTMSRSSVSVTRWTPVTNLTFSAEAMWFHLTRSFTGYSDCFAGCAAAADRPTSSRTRTPCPSTFAFSATSDPDRLTTLKEPRQETAGGFSLCRRGPPGASVKAVAAAGGSLASPQQLSPIGGSTRGFDRKAIGTSERSRTGVFRHDRVAGSQESP